MALVRITRGKSSALNSMPRVDVCAASKPLAWVGSVSVRVLRKFRCFGRAKIGARAKRETGGRGRGAKPYFA